MHFACETASVEYVEHVAETLHDGFFEAERQNCQLICVDLRSEVRKDGGDVVKSCDRVAVAHQIERGERGRGDLHVSRVCLYVFNAVDDRGHVFPVVEYDEIPSGPDSGHALCGDNLELHDGLM